MDEFLKWLKRTLGGTLDKNGNALTPGVLDSKGGLLVRTSETLPNGCQSLDFRVLFDVAPGGSAIIIDFTCPKNAVTIIQSYAIFNDGLLASDFDFIPTVDGKRVYPYQGDPLTPPPYRIYLGVSTDLSDVALIPGRLDLQSGKRLVWTAFNRSAVATTMGVRVSGYVDPSGKATSTRFGG